MNKLIFITGVHGVGKSNLAKKLSEKFNINFFTASEIITRTSNNIYHKLNYKCVPSIEENQSILLTELLRIRVLYNIFILDGHFVLLNQDSIPTPIAVEFISKIAPSLVILITDDPRKIAKRISNRDGQLYDTLLITKMQDLERITVTRYCKNLGIPHIEIDIQSNEDPLSELSSWLSKNMYD